LRGIAIVNDAIINAQSGRCGGTEVFWRVLVQVFLIASTILLIVAERAGRLPGPPRLGETPCARRARTSAHRVLNDELLRPWTHGNGDFAESLAAAASRRPRSRVRDAPTASWTAAGCRACLRPVKRES